MTDNLPGGFRRVLPAILLVLITLLAYIPAVKHGGFIWDDEDNITDAPVLGSASGLRDIWSKVGMEEGGTMQYYPLTYTSFWLEYRLWGLNPLGYHLNNVLLHALNAVLVWIILVRLRVPGALLAAAIFAVHPVHVESVAWITERKNVLSGLFYLLSLMAFIRFFGLDRADGVTPVPGEGRRACYYSGLFLFLCALLSKSATVTLPPTILLLIWWRSGRIGLKNLSLTAPIFLLAISSGLITTFVERFPGGAMGKEWALSAPEHLLLAGRVLWFYAGKLLWPQPLMFVYPRWEISQAVWWQYLFPLGAIAVMAALWLLRGRIGRGPLAAVLFFAGTLATVLGFINVYFMRFSYVADHFQYLASLGPIVILAAGAGLIYRNLCLRSAIGRAVALISALGLIALLGSLTWRQSRVYRSEDVLWTDTLGKNPDCWLARHNLGVFLADRGEAAEAIAHYREALRIDRDAAITHNNLGLSLAGLGRTEEAIGHYRESLRMAPNYSNTRNNLGRALAGLGRAKEAELQYREALRIRPDYPEAHKNLGLVLAGLGRTKEAEFHYLEALRIRPDYPEARNYLGVLLSAIGRTEEATVHYREVLRISPGDLGARNNLCLALSALGRTREAEAEYRELLRIKPDFNSVYYDLGLVLAEQAAFPGPGRRP